MFLLMRLGSALAKLGNVLCLAFAVFIATGFITPDLEGSGRSTEVLLAMGKLDKQAMDLTRDFFPTKFKQKDISRYVALGLTVVLAWLLANMANELAHRSSLRRVKMESKKIQAFLKAGGPANKQQNKSSQLLATKVQQLETAKGSDRSVVLKEFLTLKKQLEAMTRYLAFLSVDVVGSTAMKVGEDTYVITNDFNEYRGFIELRIKSNSCIKYTTTPDGLMACFPDADSAVVAAQSIIKDLPDFNRNVKHMKQDFVVRCGVNGGKLFFDDSLPLEQISDHVIDVAGHMQKYAKPSTILASEEVAGSLKLSNGFVATDMVVDELKTHSWRG